MSLYLPRSEAVGAAAPAVVDETFADAPPAGSRPNGARCIEILAQPSGGIDPDLKPGQQFGSHISLVGSGFALDDLGLVPGFPPCAVALALDLAEDPGTQSADQATPIDHRRALTIPPGEEFADQSIARLVGGRELDDEHRIRSVDNSCFGVANML